MLSALPLMAVYQCIKLIIKSFLYFQRYAPEELFTAKIKKGSNSLNTCDKVMVLAFCNSPHGPLSIIFNTFKDVLKTNKSVMDRPPLGSIKKFSYEIWLQMAQ